MMSIISFDIILVPFPFTDLSRSKKRPCLVLVKIEAPKLEPLFVVSMITSQVHGLQIPFDVHLENYQKANLPKPSLVRLSKLVTLDHSMIEKKLGHLSERDTKQVKAVFGKMLRSAL